MADRVVVYLSPTGKPLRRAHQRIALEEDAKTIARLRGSDFAGYYTNELGGTGSLFFVPDQTLLLEEAQSLGIRSTDDFFGGVVPRQFVKTKSISHPLISSSARRPDGWSESFSMATHRSVLPGYSAFHPSDARVAAERLLPRDGGIRLKRTLCSGGRGQIVIAAVNELEQFLTEIRDEELATYGLVLEANLRDVKTLSIGFVLSYYGTQRRTRDNDGNPAYGGSDLVCVRGDWDALLRATTEENVRVAVEQAKSYNDAMREFPGFMASRRNYDVGQGFDAQGRWRSGVFESSWRVGGASPAELLAIAAFIDDPEVTIIEACHYEKYGHFDEPPDHSTVHFRGEDPQAGPLMRYTTLTRRQVPPFDLAMR
jgi:hypothetical protein